MAYTTIDNPELYFQTKTYSGDGSTDVSHTFDGSENMQADMVWFKRLNGSANHFLYDSVRGANRSLVPNDTDTEATSGEQTSYFSSFDSDGFTLGHASNNVNGSGQSYVLWAWKAGTAFSNDASSTSIGDVDSSGSAATIAGFSICSYTGSGSSGDTIKHGLNKTPEMLIFKNRSSTITWIVGSKPAGFTNIQFLQGTAAATDDENAFNDTNPTSSVFTLGGNLGTGTNETNSSFICYAFTSIQGYSKVGKYIGNGNADGTFVYTGFRPAWIMFKPLGESADWTICDNKRNTFNVVKDKTLNANLASAEHDGSMDFDILSNGFKVRNANTDNNSSNAAGILYLAFAEQPFVNSNGVPNNAR